MKRAAIYLRVSSLDQHPETQLCDLQQMAAARKDEVVREYTDRISGAKQEAVIPSTPYGDQISAGGA